MAGIRYGLLAGFLLLTGCRPLFRPAAETPGRSPTALSFKPEQARRALEHVSDLLALGPRDAGTPGAENAARWLVGRLHEAGLTAVRTDSFVDRTPDGSNRFHNVLAEWPGAEQAWILLLSHFDTKSGIATAQRPFTGANDGGSSTGLLLELAAAVAQGGRQRYGILFAFLDGEECRYAYSERDGLHGSRHLARAMKASSRPIRAVILMDMVGDRDLHIAIPRNGTPALQALALAAAARLGLRDDFSLLDGSILDDHQPFLDAGYPAVNLIDFTYGSRPGANDYWHTPEDTLDKLSADSLHKVGAVVLEMLHRLQQ